MNVQEPALKRNVARQDNLPGHSAASETPDEHRRETVLLIHGTFANEALSWWLPGSDFCRKLDAALLRRKSWARCWAHIVNPTEVFAWTGSNLEIERRFAGDMLAKEIINLETTTDIDRYHIVAHSHGGNVVLNALHSLAESPKKLGAIIFLGTPVLSFPRLLPWLNRSGLSILLYASGLLLGIIAAVYRRESLYSITTSEGSPVDALFFTGEYPWFILLAVGFGLSLLYEFMTRLYRLLPIYGSGHSHAFEFVSDEAMKALQLSLAIAQRPRDVLKQIYGTKAAPAYAVNPPRDEFWKGLWSDFQTTAIYRLLKDLPSASLFSRGTKSKTVARRLTTIVGTVVLGSALLTALLTLPDSYIDIYYFQKEKPYVADLIGHVRWMVKTFSNASVSLMFGVALFCLIVMCIWRFLLALNKVARSSFARAIQLLLQGPGVWIMGRVVRNAAFGGQAGIRAASAAGEGACAP